MCEADARIQRVVAQFRAIRELRAENERLRTLLGRTLEYTRCLLPCAGYDDELACDCGRVKLDDEISEIQGTAE